MKLEVHKYREEVQEQVGYCVTCQPYDGGDYVWVLGDEIEIDNLLQDLEVPEHLWQEVLDGVYCGNCGNSVELGDVVGTKTAEERAWEALHKRWAKELRPEFDEFQAHLERWPYLGVNHALGKKIAHSIPNFSRTEIRNQDWFRARLPDKGRLFTAEDITPPDPELMAIPEGRYNHFGQQVFYLAANEDAAMLETLQGEGGVAWVQKFLVSKADNILDLQPDWFSSPPLDSDLLGYGLIFGGHLEREVERLRGWKPEYFVPRFVADCARFAGFDGIKFSGVRSWASNLVLFKWESETVVPKDAPRILQISKPTDPF